MLAEKALYELPQDFKDEIEVLENSYSFEEGEATIVFYQTHSELFLKLIPLEADEEEEDEDETARITVQFRFPKTYPVKSPQVYIISSETKGLTKKQQKELEVMCRERMKNELEGSIVVHDIVILCQEYLGENKFTAQEYLSLRKRLENKMRKENQQKRDNQEKARSLNRESVQSMIQPSIDVLAEIQGDDIEDDLESSDEDSDIFDESDDEGEVISEEDDEDEVGDGNGSGKKGRGGWFDKLGDSDEDEEEEEEGDSDEESEISSFGDDDSFHKDIQKIGISSNTPIGFLHHHTTSPLSGEEKKRLERLQCFFLYLLEKYVKSSNLASAIRKSVGRKNDDDEEIKKITSVEIMKKIVNKLKIAGLFPENLRIEDEQKMFQGLFKPHIQFFEKRKKRIEDMSLEYQSPISPSASSSQNNPSFPNNNNNVSRATSPPPTSALPFKTGMDWELDKILWEGGNESSSGGSGNENNELPLSSIKRSPSSELTMENLVSYESQSRYMSDFEFIKIIGQGAFGEVVLAKNIYDKRKYAIKKIVFQKDDAKEKLMTKREVSLLSQLVHENVVRYYNCWMEDYHEDKVRNYSFKSNRYDNILFIQMEYCETTLEKLIRKRILYQSNHRSVIWECVRQVLQGLQYLHERDIIHRDLKPSNLFVKIRKEPGVDGKVLTRYIMKIGDFGLARRGAKKKNRKPTQYEADNTDNSNEVKNEEAEGENEEEADKSSSGSERSFSFNSSSLTHNIGTLTYTAPEVLAKEKYGTKIDLYALGITFFEMCLKFDSRHERGKLLTDLRRTGRIHCPYWPKSWEREKELIERLVVHSPRSRPSAYELLHSGFLPMDIGSQRMFLSQVFTQEPEVDVEGCGQEELSPLNTYVCYYKEAVMNCFVRVAQQHGAARVPISSVLPHSVQTKSLNEGGLDSFQKVLFQPPRGSSSYITNNPSSASVNVHCLPTDLTAPLARDLSRRPGIRGKGMLKRYSNGHLYKMTAQGSVSCEEWFVFDSISASEGIPQAGILEAELCHSILSMAECLKPRKEGKWVLRINHCSFFEQLLEKCVIPKRLHPEMAKLFEYRLQTGMTWPVFYKMLRANNIGMVWEDEPGVNLGDEGGGGSSSGNGGSGRGASVFQLGLSEKNIIPIEFYTQKFFSTRDPYESLMHLEQHLRSGRNKTRRILTDFNHFFRLLEHYGILDQHQMRKHGSRKPFVKIVLDPFCVPPHDVYQRYEGGIVFSLDIMRKKSSISHRSYSRRNSNHPSRTSNSVVVQVGYGGTIHQGYVSGYLPAASSTSTHSSSKKKNGSMSSSSSGSSLSSLNNSSMDNMKMLSPDGKKKEEKEDSSSNKSRHPITHKVICGMNFCMERIYDTTNLRVKCLGGRMRPFLHGIPQVMILVKEGGVISPYSTSSTTPKKKKKVYPWVELGIELATFLWSEIAWKADFFYENSILETQAHGLNELIVYCVDLQIEWICILKRNRKSSQLSVNHFNLMEMKVQVLQILDFRKIQKNQYRYSRQKCIKKRNLFVHELPVYLESGGKTTNPGDLNTILLEKSSSLRPNNSSQHSSSSSSAKKDAKGSESDHETQDSLMTPKNIKNISFASCGIKPKYSFQKDLQFKAKQSYEEMYEDYMKVNKGVKIVVVLELSKLQIVKAVNAFKEEKEEKFLLNQKHQGTYKAFFRDLHHWKKNPSIVFVCFYSVNSETSILVEVR